MAQTPLTFKSITCKHCGGIVALIPEGAFIHTTHLRCIHCKGTETIKIVDKARAKTYNIAQPA
jgi:phage FluMu protein Com